MAGERRQTDRPRSSRANRLAAALRENLKRRKAQTKGRARTAARESDPAHDSAGMAPEIVIDKPKR
jgi:hypothetical protein